MPWHFSVIQFASRRCNSQFIAKKTSRRRAGSQGCWKSAERLTEEQRKETSVAPKARNNDTAVVR